MSEALHHKEVPGSVPAPVPADRIGEVIPFPLRGEEQDAEKLDFSEATPDDVAEFLMSELRHPSRKGHEGVELATDIEKMIPIKGQRAPEPGSLEERLVEIIQQEALTSEEIYDHKIDHDTVFQLLSEKLLYARDRRELYAQFNATRNLAHLRSTVADETSSDEEWRSVIDRLFS